MLSSHFFEWFCFFQMISFMECNMKRYQSISRGKDMSVPTNPIFLNNQMKVSDQLIEKIMTSIKNNDYVKHEEHSKATHKKNSKQNSSPMESKNKTRSYFASFCLKNISRCFFKDIFIKF